MLSFGAKKCKNAFCRGNPSLIKFSTSSESLYAFQQRGASDWKTLKKLKFVRRQIFYEFLKNRLIRKSDDRFWKLCKRQADTKACVFLDMDHKVIFYRISSVHFATANFHPFCTIIRLKRWLKTFFFSRKIRFSIDFCQPKIKHYKVTTLKRR